MLIYQQLIRAFFECTILDAAATATTKHVTILRRCTRLQIQINRAHDALPSVSFRGTDKSSSLATCLCCCPKEPAKGIDEGVSDDV